MKRFWRLIFGLLMLLIMSFVCFALIYYSQGSVAYANVVQGMSPATKIQIEINLNLHEPLLKQYQIWLINAFKGDFSYSLISGESVTSIIKEKLPLTLILGTSAFILLVILSLICGILSLFFTFFDRLISVLSISVSFLPTFCVGLLLILFFGVGLLPSSGVSDIGKENDIYNRFLHLILPVCTLTISHLGVFAQFVRTTLIDAINQGFVQFGLARGLSLFYIYTHWVLKYALSPIIAYFSASFVSFLMGVYVVENVFNYAGIGESLIRGLIFKDYPLVLAILVLSFLTVLIINFISDLLCGWLNQGRI